MSLVKQTHYQGEEAEFIDWKLDLIYFILEKKV